MHALPLQGIRVVEYSQGIAAPIAARIFAMHGAEVIKLESVERPDITRQYGASWLSDSVSSQLRMDTSPLVSEFLAGKLSIGLNPETAEGKEVIAELIRRSDVFLINLSVGVVEKLGLTYDQVHDLNPSIIYASLTGFGNSQGPYRFYRAWGPNQSALAGVDILTGWGDRPPAGVSTFALPDYTSAGHAAIAILAALTYRDLTGVGQAVDMSQFESTVAALGSVLLEVSLGGDPRRLGSSLVGALVSGIYPCRDSEDWVALSCQTMSEYERLSEVVPGIGEVQNPHEEASVVDELIANWTSGHHSGALALELQMHGIAAAAVADGLDLILDEHLAERKFYRLAPHSRFGHEIFTGYPVTLSRTPASAGRAGPSLGEDTADILERILEMKDEERKRLTDEGVAVGMVEPETRFERPYWKWLKHIPTRPRSGDE